MKQSPRNAALSIRADQTYLFQAIVLTCTSVSLNIWTYAVPPVFPNYIFSFLFQRADFTSKASSPPVGEVDAVTQSGGLQIGSPSSKIVSASSLPFENRGVRLSVFEDFVNTYGGKEYEC